MLSALLTRLALQRFAAGDYPGDKTNLGRWESTVRRGTARPCALALFDNVKDVGYSQDFCRHKYKRLGGPAPPPIV